MLFGFPVKTKNLFRNLMVLLQVERKLMFSETGLTKVNNCLKQEIFCLLRFINFDK